MRGRVKWVEERTFVGETASGARIVFGMRPVPTGNAKARPEPDGAGDDRNGRLFRL